MVDTDLGGDDLVALAFLLRHPQVHVDAITIAATGLVGCDPGVDLVADLLTALGEDPVEVACGRADPGRDGLAFPEDWRAAAAAGSGLPRSASTLTASSKTAPELIAERADSVAGLVVVALGPMTNLADVASSAPQAYARLARVLAMGGSVDGPMVDGIAEWNAAADPASVQGRARGAGSVDRRPGGCRAGRDAGGAECCGHRTGRGVDGIPEVVGPGGRGRFAGPGCRHR